MGTMAGFFKGVSLLYGSEIAINHEIIANDTLSFKTSNNNQDYLLMDFESQRKNYLNDPMYANRIIHVHVWQTEDDEWFAKGDDGFDWMRTQRQFIGDFDGFIAMSNEYAIEWREWCTALAFGLHYNLSVHMFDIGKAYYF